MNMELSTQHIKVKPQHSLMRGFDYCLRPLMRLISGAWAEEPQSTHRWNYQYLNSSEVSRLNKALQVQAPIDARAEPLFRYYIPTHHLTFLGGWRKYLVLSPKEPGQGWYIGWLRDDSKAVSQIKLHSPVRMLVSQDNVHFFALDGAGQQIELEIVGQGTIGDGQADSNLPLL